MKRYILKRILTGIVVVLVSVCLNFVLIRSAPGDPVRILAGVDDPNPAQIEALTIKYAVDAFGGPIWSMAASPSGSQLLVSMQLLVIQTEFSSCAHLHLLPCVHRKVKLHCGQSQFPV